MALTEMLLKALKAMSKSFSVTAMSSSILSFSADLAACFLLGVPDVTFPVRQNNQWVNITSEELFKGKTVVLLPYPGHSLPPVPPPIYPDITN